MRDPLKDPSWYELDSTPESTKPPYLLIAAVICFCFALIGVLAFWPWN